tara:strand:- start:97 stop:279 length:183 start_codon:yes stop_codon:yes gene_type:complete
MLASDPKLPLTSTFAESLAVHTLLAEACKVLDNPDADHMEKLVAENTIIMIINSIELPEQ